MTKNKVVWLFLFITFFLFSETDAQRIVPIHSHNDYEHEKPLYDAISCFVKSIEADVYLRNDTMFVCHSVKECKPGRTLEKMYFKPLAEMIEKGNWNYNETLFLLIDIKSDAAETYEALKPLFEKYSNMLTSYKNGIKTADKEITVIISGNRPVNIIKGETECYAAIDGRWNEYDFMESPDLYPLISNNWFSMPVIAEGNNDDEKFAYIQRTIKNLNNSGKLVRFWGTPDSPVMWELLKKLGVNLINTDRVKELTDYIKNEK